MSTITGKNKEYRLQTIRMLTSISEQNIVTSNVDKEYYFVFLTRQEHGLAIYVNLIKSQFADMFKLDRRLQPTEGTDMVEYNWYFNCKDQTQPLWKLSYKHCLELRARLDAE